MLLTVCHWPFFSSFFSFHVFLNVAVAFTTKGKNHYFSPASMKQQTHSLKGHGETSGLVPHSNSSSFDLHQTPDARDPSALTAIADLILRTSECQITVCFELPRKCCSCIGRIYGVIGWWDVIHDRNSIALSFSISWFLCAFKITYPPVSVNDLCQKNKHAGKKKDCCVPNSKLKRVPAASWWDNGAEHYKAFCVLVKRSNFLEEKGNSLFWRANAAM